MEQAKPKSSMTDFRKQNPRIDYYPTPDALAAIERLRKTTPNASTRELIDTLVVAGEKVWFPDKPSSKAC